MDTGQGIGLGLIDGMPSYETETAKATEVFIGQAPARVLITVRRSHVTVTCEDRVLIDWLGDFGRFSLNPVWAVPDESALFVGSYNSSFAISKLRLVPISETGKVLATP